MELVVINGANAISRGVVSRLAGKQYQKIRLLDFRPFRKSVYQFQRELPSGVQLEKFMVQNAAALEHQLDGAQDVLYFTHDYTANAADKNTFIQGAAKLAKKHGVSKFVAVCPVEHELFYTEDNHTPLEKQNEAQQKALQSNSNFSILNSNLVFGKDSYLIHYMAQCALSGRINAKIGGSNGYQFKPVSGEDLTQAVETALSRFDEAKGHRFSVNGKDELTLKEIMGYAEVAVGSSQGQTKLSQSLLRLNISDYVEEFFVGITHDKNMRRLAEFFESQKPNLTENNPDFFQKFNLTHKQSMRDIHGGEAKEENLVFPLFSSYKMTSLD